MTYRKCRNPHRTDGPTMEQIVTLAIECFGWKRPKVLSWYAKENLRLKKARPQELVDRGQGELVIEFLEERRRERLHNQEVNEIRIQRKLTR